MYIYLARCNNNSWGTYPTYIHFSLQKTNRDTQDALGQLSRLLHVNVKDLSVAGTRSALHHTTVTKTASMPIVLRTTIRRKSNPKMPQDLEGFSADDASRSIVGIEDSAVATAF